MFYFSYIWYYAPVKYIIDGQEFATLDEYLIFRNETSANANVGDPFPLEESLPYYGGIRAPGEDYGSAKIAAVVILTAILVDTLAIAGIYIKYKGICVFF